MAQIEREKTYIQLFKEQTEKTKLVQAKNDLENLQQLRRQCVEVTDQCQSLQNMYDKL